MYLFMSVINNRAKSQIRSQVETQIEGTCKFIASSIFVIGLLASIGIFLLDCLLFSIDKNLAFDFYFPIKIFMGFALYSGLLVLFGKSIKNKKAS